MRNFLHAIMIMIIIIIMIIVIVIIIIRRERYNDVKSLSFW